LFHFKGRIFGSQLRRGGGNRAKTKPHKIEKRHAEQTLREGGKKDAEANGKKSSSLNLKS